MRNSITTDTSEMFRKYLAKEGITVAQLSFNEDYNRHVFKVELHGRQYYRFISICHEKEAYKLSH